MKQPAKIDIKELPIDSLKLAEYNPRTIDKASFKALVNSIKTFGQRENMVVNKDMTVISGHMRLKAMQELGYTTAMCDVVDLTKVQEKKLNIIMNSPLMQGQFDLVKLDELLAELSISEVDLDDFRLPELGTLDLSDSDAKLPDGDKPGIQQITFTLTDEQAATVKSAISMIKADRSSADDKIDTNSNGAALTVMAEYYLDGRE